MSALAARRIFLEGVAIGWILWAVMLSFSLIYPIADMPPGPSAGQMTVGWFDVSLLACISHFLYIKSWMMYRRSAQKTLLGISLVLANASFALAYQFQVAYMLWPELGLNVPFRRGVRIELLLVTALGVIMLGMSRDPIKTVEEKSS